MRTAQPLVLFSLVALCRRGEFFSGHEGGAPVRRPAAAATGGGGGGGAPGMAGACPGRTGVGRVSPPAEAPGAAQGGGTPGFGVGTASPPCAPARAASTSGLRTGAKGSLRDTDVGSLQAPHLPGVDAREHPRRSAWERGLGAARGRGSSAGKGRSWPKSPDPGWFAVWGGPLRNTLRHRCLGSATAGAGLAGTDSVAEGQAVEMKRQSLTPGRETSLALPRQSPDAMRSAFSGPQFLAPTVWPKLVL